MTNTRIDAQTNKKLKRRDWPEPFHLNDSRPKKRLKQPARTINKQALYYLHIHNFLFRTTAYHTFIWKSAQLCFGGSLLAIRWLCLWVGKDDNINKVMSFQQNIYHIAQNMMKCSYVRYSYPFNFKNKKRIDILAGKR